MPQPIYLPPPRDPFESILPFAMRLYEMKQRKDIAESELSQRKSERESTERYQQESLRAGMVQRGFEPVDRQEAQDQGLTSGTAIAGTNWRKPERGLKTIPLTMNGRNVGVAVQDPVSGEFKIDVPTERQPAAEIQEYQYAVQNGYKGTFQQWVQQDSRKQTIVQPTSTQANKEEWTDDQGVKWVQDRVFDPKAQTFKNVGSPRKVGTDTTVMQRVREADKIRGEFQGLKDVKQFQEVDTRMKMIDQALEESKTTKNFVAVDQALITTFNRITDPDSVVRESEWARTPESLALVDRMKGKIAKVAKGGAGLTQDDREALRRMAKEFYKVSQKKYSKRTKEYRGYLTNVGVDPEQYLSPSEATVDQETPNTLDKYWK